MRRSRINLAALISTAEAADLSRSEIARRVGVSPPYITRLANGERGTRPSFAIVTGLQRVVRTVTTSSDAPDQPPSTMATDEPR